MQETTKIFLRNIAAKAKDISTHLSIERMTERETRATQPLPSNAATQQKQTDHPAPRSAAKSKKQHMPFMALALVMIFISLCGLALLGLRPIAWADNSPSSDATVTPAPESVP